jgi:hypothetical protein
VVAVAEPREVRRARLAAEHGVAERDAVADWRQLASHLAVIAAEQARLNGTVETISY